VGRDEIRLGRLDPRRDLTFVKDTVEGFLGAGLADGVEGETIHLGTGTDVSIGELFEIACRVLGKQARVVQDPTRLRPDASEVMVLLSDPTQARERLAWTSQISIEQGLELTARWIEENIDLFQPDRYHV